MPPSNTRLEHDLLGDFAVPADAYYGVQTARALENFRISGVELRLYPNFIKALAMVKLAAARANFETGGFSRDVLTAIEGACEEIIAGKLHDQFHLDVLQGGAGTSTNMNANEVIANRALELMGHKKGEYKYCDPANSPEKGNPVFHGGDIFAIWLITGETRPYNASGAYFRDVRPAKTVLQGGPGAWEALLRFSYSDLNDAAVAGGTFWRITPMVNWYATDYTRLEFAYGYGVLDRFALKGATQFFQSRFQFQF